MSIFLMAGMLLTLNDASGQPCSFVESEAIYICTGDDCLCKGNKANCTGIKLKVMDVHPSLPED